MLRMTTCCLLLFTFFACAKKGPKERLAGERRIQEPRDLSDPTLADEMLQFEPLNPKEFEMQGFVFGESLGEMSVPRIFVYNLHQDYTEYKACKGQDCQEGAFPTPEAYLPLDTGKWEVRIRGCLSYGRTETDEKQCGPWSQPMSYDQENQVPPEFLASIQAFNRANMDVFANGEKIYRTFYDFMVAGSQCEHPPYADGSEEILAASTANIFAQALNEGAYPFEEYQIKEEEEGLALAGKTGRSPVWTTMWGLFLHYNSLQGTPFLDRSTLTFSEWENIKFWETSKDERQLRKARKQLEAKRRKKVQADVITRIDAQLDVLNRRIAELVTTRLKAIEAKIQKGETLTGADEQYLKARKEEIPEDQFKRLLAENKTITIKQRVAEIGTMDFPKKVDLAELRAFRKSHPELVSQDLIDRVEATRKTAVAAKKMEADRIRGVQKRAIKKWLAETRSRRIQRRTFDTRRITERTQELGEIKAYQPINIAKRTLAEMKAQAKTPDPVLQKSEAGLVKSSPDMKAKAPTPDPVLPRSEFVDVPLDEPDSALGKPTGGYSRGTALKAGLGIAAMLGATAAVGAVVYAYSLSENPTCEGQAVGDFRRSLDGIKADNERVLDERDAGMDEMERVGLSVD
ncbi:MAG: hypothetical protein HYW48_05910 [Deltaproteobacteria bacterium]|nr:hypothetical protein [Deltaproteobacteria bacterium]